MKKSTVSFWLDAEERRVVESVADHFGLSLSKALSFILSSFQAAAELASISAETINVAAPSSGPKEN